MPLIGVVPVLQSLLLSVACVFSKPQRRHLENYLQGLICQEHRRTLAAMSRHVPLGPDGSNWERFVTASPWELPALNRAWRRFLRRELRRLKPEGKRIGGRQVDFLAFDDTHHRRTGPGLEGAGYHYVHSAQRTQFSHCLVTAAYVSGDYAFGYSCDPYVRAVDVAALNARWAAAGKEQRLVFRSKTAMVVAQLEAFQPLRPGRPVFVLLDSWYVNRQIVGAARAKQLDWCGMLKSNRVVHLLEIAPETGEIRAEGKTTVAALAAEETGERQQERFVVGGAAQEFRVGKRAFQATAYRGTLPQIGVVQVVVVREQYEPGRFSPWVALATKRLDLAAAEVVEVYLQRWEVEVLHGDLKQNLGLTDCQMRSLAGTQRHYALAFLSQAMLTLLRLRAARGEVCTASGQTVVSVGQTLGEVRQFVRQSALVELLRYACEQAAQGRSVTEIALALGLPA
jgi:DDE superfamily endonuclease